MRNYAYLDPARIPIICMGSIKRCEPALCGICAERGAVQCLNQFLDISSVGGHAPSTECGLRPEFADSRKPATRCTSSSPRAGQDHARGSISFRRNAPAEERFAFMRNDQCRDPPGRGASREIQDLVLRYWSRSILIWSWLRWVPSAWRCTTARTSAGRSSFSALR